MELAGAEVDSSVLEEGSVVHSGCLSVEQAAAWGWAGTAARSFLLRELQVAEVAREAADRQGAEAWVESQEGPEGKVRRSCHRLELSVVEEAEDSD